MNYKELQEKRAALWVANRDSRILREEFLSHFCGNSPGSIPNREFLANCSVEAAIRDDIRYATGRFVAQTF